MSLPTEMIGDRIVTPKVAGTVLASSRQSDRVVLLLLLDRDSRRQKNFEVRVFSESGASYRHSEWRSVMMALSAYQEATDA